MDWAAITWDSARAGGFAAYLLLTGSIVLGLTLSLGVRSRDYPRFLSRELHNHLVLLTLVFTGLHSLAVWVDPFTKYTPVEVLVPFASHYRPLWVALGITTAYLLLAIYLSERIRPWVGWTWWRRFHYLAFPVWALATLHGLGSGSDSQAGWAFAIYALAFSGVGALLAFRLLTLRTGPGVRAALAGGTLLMVAGGWLWALQGPMQPGWNQVANNGNGSGSRLAAATAATPSPGLNVPFQSGFTGTMTLSPPDATGASSLAITGRLEAGPQGSLTLDLRGRQRASGFSVTAGRVTYQPPTGAGYSGPVVNTRGGQVIADLSGPGAPIQLQVSITGASGQTVQGEVEARAAAG